MSAQTCPGMPISNRNSTFYNNIVKQLVLFNLKSVQLSVLHNPAKTAWMVKIWFSRYFEKGSQPMRLPRFSNLNIS